MLSALPGRPDGVDDVLCRQCKGRRNGGFSRLHFSDLPALFQQQLCTGGLIDGAVDAVTIRSMRIRRIYDRICFDFCNIVSDDPDKAYESPLVKNGISINATLQFSIPLL
jgi:hypothetical protein